MQINEYTVGVRSHNGNLAVKPETLEPLEEPASCEEVRAMQERQRQLRQCELLDRSAYIVLGYLGKQTYMSEVSSGLLSWQENDYGVV